MDFINKMRMRAKSVSQRSKSGSKKIRRQSSAPTVRRMRSSSSDAKDLHLPNAYVSITYVPLVFQTFNSLQIQYTHTHTHTQTGLKIKKKVHREFEVSIPCTTKNMKEKQ